MFMGKTSLYETTRARSGVPACPPGLARLKWKTVRLVLLGLCAHLAVCDPSDKCRTMPGKVSNAQDDDARRVIGTQILL